MASANLYKHGSQKASLENGIKWAMSILEDKVWRRKLCVEEFHMDDKDNSGTLDRKEVVGLITKICDAVQLPLPKPERIDELLLLCDRNGDGVLQVGEFQAFFKVVVESALKKALAEVKKFHVKKVGGAKNGSTREVPIKKAPKFYTADDIPEKDFAFFKRDVRSRGMAKLRSSITPGTVLILLAGRFRGRRVVFLKQLPSGLLLVTGPYSVNGIPLRRVNQAYVIATSTKVDIAKVDAAALTDDAFGKKEKKKRKRTGEDAFEEETESKGPSEEMLKKQKTVDDALLAAMKKTPMMAKYLKARFSLSKSDKPHAMAF